MNSLRGLPVDFYSPSGEYGWLANFSNHPISIKGCVWRSVEHYYQAMKFPPGQLRDMIANAESAAVAKSLAARHKAKRRGDWSRIKALIMYTAIRAKFTQHPSLCEALLNTGDRIIREVTPHDGFWGTGPCGDGDNRMGHLLMTLRTHLRGE